MAGKKRHRDSTHSKLKLITPLRGLKRSRSAFIKRRNSHARTDYSKASISKEWRRDVSQDSGHALNWLDSLIRKGRGILDSLEQEEDSFKRELNKERQRIRIHEQLAEKEVDQPIHEISRIDESSFGLLEETLQNTLMDYNNKNMNQDYDQEDVKEATNLRIGQEDVVMLSDKDEGSLPALHSSGEINYRQDSEELIANEERLDLNSDRSDDQGLQYDTYGKGKRDPEHSVRKTEEEASEEDDGEECGSISPQSIITTQDKFLDETSYYDADDHIVLEDFKDGFKSVHYTENQDESEVNGIPVRSDEIILIDSDGRSQSSGGREPSEEWEEEREAAYALGSNQKREQGMEQEEESGAEIANEDISDEQDAQKDYINGEQIAEDLIDYQQIANQAILQASQVSSQQTKPYNPKNDIPRFSGDFQGAREVEKRVPKSLDHNSPKFSAAENSTDPIFEPDQPTQNANASFSFLEDGNTMYFSMAEEHGLIESPAHESHSKNQSKEMNQIPSRYEVLFCQSTYSTTSDDDNAQIVEPVGAYVSPFTKEAFSPSQIGEDPSGFLRRTLESLGKSFDSEYEDQMMEDANDLNPNSKKELFRDSPDFGANDAKDTVKSMSLSDIINADMCNIRTGTMMFHANSGQILDSQMASTDLAQSRESSNNDDFLVFGPGEPDWIEEVESFQSTDDRGALILEEILPGTSHDGNVIVSSDPIIEFDSKPLNFADIILDEFTAPDLVEEPSDQDGIEDYILLEEIEVPMIGDTVHVVSTEPTVEQPGPFLSTNIELIELSESGNEEKIVDTIPDSFNQMSAFRLAAGERLVGRRLLIGNCDSESLWQGTEESHGNRSCSSTSNILLSPIRALSRVISGVKDVGNVLTDFVKTIGSAKKEMDDHIDWRLSNKNQEIKSEPQWERELEVSLFNEEKGEFSDEKKLALEYPFKTNESWTSILEKETTREKPTGSQELLSELADIQRMVQKLENGSFSAFKEDVPVKSAVGKDVSDSLVKRDDESELELNGEEYFLGSSESELHQSSFGRERMDRCEHEEEREFRVEKIKGRSDNQSGLNQICIRHLPIGEEENEGNTRKRTTRGQSYGPMETENLKKKVHGIDFYNDKRIKKGGDFPSPVKHIEVETDELDLTHLHHHKGNKEQGQPQQAKEAKIENEREEALEVPVEIERKEADSSVENRNDDWSSASLDAKKRRGRKRKHSSSVNDLNKRKGQKSPKLQNRNSRTPITRSRTASAATASKRRKNTRSKKSR